MIKHLLDSKQDWVKVISVHGPLTVYPLTKFIEARLAVYYESKTFEKLQNKVQQANESTVREFNREKLMLEY